MINATKAQMVDFVYHLYKANKKKISKARLNSLEKAEFVRIIESDEKVADAFKQYLLMENQKQEPASKPVIGKNNITGQTIEIPSDSKEAEANFIKIVDRVVSDSTNFMNIMELKGFLELLPYGTISTEVLKEQIEVLTEAATPIAMLVFDYYMNQLKRKASS